MRKTPAGASLTIVAALSALVSAAPQSRTDPAAVGPLPARRLPQIEPLDGSRTIQRFLSRGDDHRYQLALAAGECVSVVVEQHGVDVVVQTRHAAGDEIALYDDEIGVRGEERIELVADSQGTYTVAIKASPFQVAEGSYAIRVAGHRRATEADRALQEARRLRTTAAKLESAGRFNDARATFERALSLAEPLLGRDDPFVAILTFQLGGNALEMRDDARARSLYERAIATFERLWGAEHPYTAMARSRLAVVDQHTGQGPKAEAAIQQAMSTLERTVSAAHLWYAQCLISLANMRDDAGDFDKAEALERRAVATLERIGDTDSVRYAAALNNLGQVYWHRHDNERANELYLRALAVAERVEGAGSYRVSTSYQNLGIIAREQRDYAKALDYDTRALAIRERILGPDHLDIAPLVNNLATLYHAMGDDQRALSMHFRALDIWEKRAGPYHRGTLTSVGNIARLYAGIGDTAKAIAFEQRADAIIEKQLALNLGAGSERQKLAFVRSVAERTDRTISFHLRLAPDHPDAAALAALVVLQRKGRVQDAMADVFAAVRQDVAAAADRLLLDQLNETTTRLAQLALKDPDRSDPDERQRSLRELELRREELEAALSEHSARFRAQTRPVTLEAVQAAIPGDAALVEFAVYRPFNPRAERNADAYGPPRYAAYVVRAHTTPAGVDLGDAGAIDRSIAALRDALRNPSRDVTEPARAVAARIVEPLRSSLGDARRLLISPDGDLNLVPFEALVDARGRYLVERYAISYLTSGRDLLRMQVPRAARGRPVIVADPLFGEPAVDRHPAPPQAATAAAAARGGSTGGGSSMYFAPLAGTGAEARAIKNLYPASTLLTGRRATKGMLQQLKAPSILHIASHGFFLDDAGQASSGDNPLLRSGLALAGANLIENGRSDGILTALEASGLDLWGTRLVTLSACDTGVGQIRNGEGVYGLRRAFLLAGADTLVMSLWPVSDYISREAMVAYYTGLRAGLGRGDALRQAKLAMLKRASRRHPYYWAGFIQSGDWTGLDDTP